MDSTFFAFCPTFWVNIATHANTRPLTMRDLISDVPKSTGVTPFRAFRIDSTFIVLVEPTHTDGAYVRVFDTREAYTSWREAYMRVDMGQRDI